MEERGKCPPTGHDISTEPISRNTSAPVLSIGRRRHHPRTGLQQKCCTANETRVRAGRRAAAATASTETWKTRDAGQTD